MTEEIEKILQNAENLMKKAREIERADKTFDREATASHVAAVSFGIKALYEQNKAIIELLKDYKK